MVIGAKLSPNSWVMSSHCWSRTRRAHFWNKNSIITPPEKSVTMKWVIDNPGIKGNINQSCTCLVAFMLGVYIMYITNQSQFSRMLRNITTRPAARKHDCNQRGFLQKPSMKTSGPFYWHGLSSITACISNYIPYKVWDEITYPFPNFLHRWSLGMDK